MSAAGLGLIVGLIMGLTGAGGGILAVPMLVFGLHLSVAQAGPVALFAVGMAAALGALLGLRDALVRYRAASLVAATGMLLSPCGLWIAHRTDNRWLSILFALILLFVAAKTFNQAPAPGRSNRNTSQCVRHAHNGRFIWTSGCACALALAGTAAGLLSGLLGVGGGFVMVPALQRVSDLEIRSVMATSQAVIALVSMSGVVVSAATGGIAWPIATPFAGGALAGMPGARLVAARLAGPALQTGFAALSAAVAIIMVAKSLH